MSDCFKALTSFFIDKQNQRPIDIVIDKRDAPSKERKVAVFARDVREAENLVKRMEELKQIIQFSDRWQSMHE